MSGVYLPTAGGEKLLRLSPQAKLLSFTTASRRGYRVNTIENDPLASLTWLMTVRTGITDFCHVTWSLLNLLALKMCWPKNTWGGTRGNIIGI